jgi:glutamate formiminotransferase
MGRRLIECVPNFSEGRDTEKVERLVEAVRAVPGVIFLDREIDADHNRCVLTFAGPPEAVSEAALNAVGKAVESIDLNRHRGVHPRIGAADVVPFIPIEGVTLEECVRLAERVGEEIWRRFQVPVYLYEAAARVPERVNLEKIRRGQFEGLRAEIASDPSRCPDIGEPRVHPTAGATVVGARKFLIAYNINLNTPDIEVAKRIARKIRFSSGGFPFVKAMGVPLASRNQAQVSMNLTDFERTPLHRVYEAVESEARAEGVEVASSEIVGLIPRKAVEMVAGHFLRLENFQPDIVLEKRLEEAATDSASGVEPFLDALAAPTAAPGGGSASAAAGAMAAALGAMISGIMKRTVYDFESDRGFLTAAIARDAEAFRAVMAAYRIPKAERAPAVEAALRRATLAPMEVAERAAALRKQLEILHGEAPAKFSSDIETGSALADAAIRGALANVRVNLESITGDGFRLEIEQRIAALG